MDDNSQPTGSEPEKADPPAEEASEASRTRPDDRPERSDRAEPPEKKPTGRYVLKVRFGALPVTGDATATDAGVAMGAACIIRTARGTELGLALSGAKAVDGEIGETVGHVLRVATARDLERQNRIKDGSESDESSYCRTKIAERSLRMRLAGVEHLWGGERVIFYFTAEKRVDFRALVRDLAWHFHTRIELRQIGARDEARLLADFGHCGRPLCCKTFMREFAPVTMRMAKLQRTSLDPSKISGRCGRLMCCLRFEDQVYRELRRGLPNRGTRVKVGSAEGEVISTEILLQQVKVRMGDGEIVQVPVGELRPPDAGSCEARGDGGKTAGASAAGSAPPPRGGPSSGRRGAGDSRPPSPEQAREAAPSTDGEGSDTAGGEKGARRAGGRPAPPRSSRRARPKRRSHKGGSSEVKDKPPRPDKTEGRGGEGGGGGAGGPSEEEGPR